jgi:hypothetical protein
LYALFHESCFFLLFRPHQFVLEAPTLSRSDIIKTFASPLLSFSLLL